MAKAVTDLFPKLAKLVPAISELMEVAKAQLAARFLLEHKATLNDGAVAGYRLPIVQESGYPKTIPTLRKARVAVDVEEADDVRVTKTMRTMYGGVDLAYRGYRIPSAKVRSSALQGASALVDLPLFAPAAAA